MDIEKIVEMLTLDEKAALLGGSSWWYTQPIERLGVPKLKVGDGPNGIRRQEMSNDSFGKGESDESVCFPTSSLSACSFDRDLLKQISFSFIRYHRTIIQPYTNIGITGHNHSSPLSF